MIFLSSDIGIISVIIRVQSPNVHYTAECIESQYSYETTRVQCEHGKYIATPEKKNYTFRTQRKVND